MDENELTRLERYYTGALPPTEPLGLCRAYDAMADVPRLVAEVRRLRGAAPIKRPSLPRPLSPG